MKKAINFTVLVLILITVFGCHATGPASVRTGRSSYNIAIQHTNNEQLLLNLIRLRYRDVPYFLEVSSVSTSFDFTTSALGTASLPESQDKTYGLEANISYSEQPTVTYTPLQGGDFVTQLMSPIKLKTVLLLYHSGWSIERIFRVVVQNINGVKNAPSASGPTPDYVPKYERFLQVAKLLRQLQLRGALDLGQAAPDDPNNVVLEIRIADQVLESDEVKQLCGLLGLERGRNSFILTTEVGTGGKDRIAVVLRSMMASLFYVSQSIEVPTADEQAGRVTVSRYPDRNRFDWREVTGGLMHIHSSWLWPSNAYVATRYRGSWFYISDNDLTSKSTFSLLMQLFALQAGEIEATGPILTLSVTR